MPRVLSEERTVVRKARTDVIADKMALGMNIKDALAYSLLTMDYEKDDYSVDRKSVV